MSLYNDLTTVLTPYATKIKKNAADLKAGLIAENRLQERLAFDAFGTFSNSKMSVNVDNGIISIDDNNFGTSVYLELKNPLNRITGWTAATKYLTLLAGHAYKLRTIPVDGTFTGIGDKIRCAICSGESLPDYAVKAEGEEITFKYDTDTTVSLVLYISYGTTAAVMFQYALEDVTEIVSLDNREQVNAISTDVNNIEDVIYAENKINKRIASDAYGTFSNSKANVSVKDGIIRVIDNNYGNSIMLELQKPLHRISGWASATKDITCLAGHTYRLRTIPISGTFPDSNAAIYCGIASGAGSADFYVAGGGAEKTFTYESDTNVSLVLYIQYSRTLDVVFQYALEDVTPDISNQNPLNITAYFGHNKIPTIDNIEASAITLTFQDENLIVYDSIGAKIFSQTDILTAASAFQSLTVDTTNKTIRGSEFRFVYDVKKHQIAFKSSYQKWGVDEINLYTHMYNSYNAGIIYDMLVNAITYENKNSIKALQGESIPDYYIEQIETVAGNYRGDIEKVGRNGDSFVFITDVHWEGNWKHSPVLINYLVKNEDLNMVICGGDVIDGSETYHERSAEYLRLTIDKFKNTGAFVITAKGNHDKNNAYPQWSSSVHFSEEKYFGLAQKPSAMNGQIYGGDCYFYYDKVSTKTRYIVLDSKTNADATYDITSEQLTWIGGIIDNTPADYHIIVVVHSMGGYQSTTDPVAAGTNDFVFKSGATALKALLDSKLASHMIEALFFGHTHYDDVLYTEEGIPMISTNSDAKWQYYGMITPADGTVDAQCFDVVTIDYQADSNGKKHIYMRRVGRGSDRTIEY